MTHVLCTYIALLTFLPPLQVISSFAATILRKRMPIPVDHVSTASHLGESRDVFAHQLAAFLVDHYAEIMRVPEDLRAGIEERIASLERARVSWAG